MSTEFKIILQKVYKLNFYDVFYRKDGSLMTYEEAVGYIHSAPKFSKELGNRALKIILEKLGSPHKKLEFVHIAGTNGKGSTAAMLESMLRSGGYKTGLFTSPFIERFNERICFCGEAIDDGELAHYTEAVKCCMEECNTFLSEFAIIFVVSLLYFLEKGCDIVVLEAGLGGRLDATNAIEKSRVCVITKIGLDHMQYLGDTKEKIAAEKCGIIREGGIAAIYPEQDESVLEVIKKHCGEKGARLCVAPMLQNCGEKLIYNGKEVSLSLSGDYQGANASLAARTAELLGLDEKHIIYGLEHTFWPGRFEWITDRLLLDGCHNADGAEAFRKSAEKINRSITIVTCAMSDKQTDAIAQSFSGITDSIVVTELDMARAANAEFFAAEFEKCGKAVKIIKNPFEAIEYALSKSEVCAVCGSLYLIGEVRKRFKGN